MISGNVYNEYFKEQAAVLAKPLRDALCYLKDTDLTEHEEGRFPLNLGGVEMFLLVMDLDTKSREDAYPEIHRKYIDVQYCVAGGPEKATWYSDDGSNVVRSDELDTEQDILFYENNENATENSVYMTPGAYAMYFPWDVHVPGLTSESGPAKFRKVVIKVPLEACL